MGATPRRVLARAVSVLVSAMGCVVVLAPPASAHGPTGSGAPSSNYRVTVTMVPELAGLSVELSDGGTEFVVTNRSAADLAILDYSGSPYLRIDDTGVWENRNSQAVVLNSQMVPPEVEPLADPTISPDWHRLSTGHTARWHDHRAHWMDDEPAAVRAAPDRTHVVQSWSIPVEVDGRVALISGTIEWVPPPLLGGWLVVVGAVALLVVVALVWRTRPALVASTLVLGAVLVATMVGIWADSSEPTTSKLALATLPILVPALLGGAAFTWDERGTEPLWLALLAGLLVVGSAAIGSGAWLAESQLPTSLDADLARWLVACSVGVGLGVGGFSAWRLLATRFRRPIANPVS